MLQWATISVIEIFPCLPSNRGRISNFHDSFRKKRIFYHLNLYCIKKGKKGKRTGSSKRANLAFEKLFIDRFFAAVCTWREKEKAFGLNLSANLIIYFTALATASCRVDFINKGKKGKRTGSSKRANLAFEKLLMDRFFAAVCTWREKRERIWSKFISQSDYLFGDCFLSRNQDTIGNLRLAGFFFLPTSNRAQTTVWECGLQCCSVRTKNTLTILPTTTLYFLHGFGDSILLRNQDTKGNLRVL